jgi:hypothetical protein
MASGTQTSFRRFAPAVLAASLLFLAVSDAGASCLAAWLCPPPAVDDCAGQHVGSSSWAPVSTVCSFEARVDAASRASDRLELNVFPLIAPSFADAPVAEIRLGSHSQILHASSPDPPPLHALQRPLLI